MNYLTKNKIALYLAVIFMAGGITGTVIAWGSAKGKFSQPPSMDKVCTKMQDRLKSQLELTPDQLERIQPILDRTSQEMRAIHEKTMKEIDEAIQRSHAEIARELNPEQRRKLEALQQERRELMEKRLKRPPGPSTL